MRRFGLVAALLLLVGVLAACQITITYNPPSNPISVTANADNTTAIRSGVAVGPGSTVSFDVLVPSTVRNNYPLVYFEVSDTLNLSLIDYNNYAPKASSSTTSVFASGSAGLQSLSAGGGLASQAIGANYSCHGPCIIWPTDSTSHYYLTVENTGTSTATFDLYVYGFDYQDPYDQGGGNDSQASAVSYAGGAESGAIETLGDVDWWQITGGNGTLTFSKILSNSIELQLEQRASDMSYVDSFTIGGPNPDSATISIRNGDYLIIRSANNHAGATGASRYDLNY